ncbi:MAG: hypothetical protein ACFE95_22605 [Candidatus Hodarchaeota archaeon]
MEAQFTQLNPFFEQNLFGVEFDYNPSKPQDQSLYLKNDILSQIPIQEGSDPEPKENNSIGLIGHEAHEIKSAVFALGDIARTEEIESIGSIEWQTTVPFVKFLHQFSLPTGETVILGHDFLGMALKVNGSGFTSDHYQLGYANIPIDLLEFLIEESTKSKVSTQKQGIMKITEESHPFSLMAKRTFEIQEKMNELLIDITYSNLTYLFQTNNFDLEDISELNIADHFIIVQFDSVVFSLILRKYENHGIKGVETVIEITIGNVINLIINEELLPDQTWNLSSEHWIVGNYKEFIPIEETFSWYRGLDIQKRLDLFSDVSFSYFTSQYLGVLNETTAIDNLQLMIDNQNKTKAELWQNDLTVNNGFSINYGVEQLFSSPIKGRDFAIQQNESSESMKLIPLEIKTIAQSQHVGLANSFLFSQENSLIRELIAECVQRYSTSPSISPLSTDQLFSVAGLDLSSAYYVQDFQVKKWNGFPFKLNLIQFATKASSDSLQETKKTGLTEISFVPGIIALLIFAVILKRKNMKRLFR